MLDAWNRSEERGEQRSVAPCVFLEYGTEDVLFVFEVGIEGAAGLACICSDVFEAGVFEPVPREDSPGRTKQLLPRQRGPLLFVKIHIRTRANLF